MKQPNTERNQALDEAIEVVRDNESVFDGAADVKKVVAQLEELEKDWEKEILQELDEELTPHLSAQRMIGVFVERMKIWLAQAYEQGRQEGILQAGETIKMALLQAIELEELKGRKP